MGLERCQYMGVLLYYHLKEPKGSERNGKTQSAQECPVASHLHRRGLDCIPNPTTRQVSYNSRKEKPLVNQILSAHDMIADCLHTLYEDLKETTPNSPEWHTITGQIKGYRSSLLIMGIPSLLIPKDPYDNFIATPTVTVMRGRTYNV